MQRVVDFLNGDEGARAAQKGQFYYRTVRQWMVDIEVILLQECQVSIEDAFKYVLRRRTACSTSTADVAISYGR